ncbi:hypothetical protein K2173_013558 [Erythroxylum novogranatense]|uniref:Squalene synthase n=1 Tax=Erythroxylum novogranatense TaxID=1862640 RepID=A0AAV8TL59_9ROSI|nr:hypothetical protein K2173_013558 [Erythroxylum novogranatense]
MAMKHTEKQIPPQPHWRFCYTMLQKVSRSFALAIQQLDTEFRDAGGFSERGSVIVLWAINSTYSNNICLYKDFLEPSRASSAVAHKKQQQPNNSFCQPPIASNTDLVLVCIFYLVLRALDTIEDDTSIPTDIKVPTLIAFHRHLYDREWHFSCGTKDYKVLMDQFHHVQTAFAELDKGFQEAIEEITRRTGVGIAKFICKEVETIDGYDEYCHIVAGVVGLGLSKLFHASQLEDLAPDYLSNSMGLFLQKVNIICDYLEDINEIPKCRLFWPREIWGKYVMKLEDLKYEENSVKAVQCLNDMVTNSLIHVEDCLKYMSALQNPAIFRFCAIPQIMAIGTLAMCYNNIEVFRGVVKMSKGLAAKVIDRTRTMSDVYGAFFDFSCTLQSKVDKNDPNASKTLNRLEAIQRTWRESGYLSKRLFYCSL